MDVIVEPKGFPVLLTEGCGMGSRTMHTARRSSVARLPSVGIDLPQLFQYLCSFAILTIIVQDEQRKVSSRFVF